MQVPGLWPALPAEPYCPAPGADLHQGRGAGLHVDQVLHVYVAILPALQAKLHGRRAFCIPSQRDITSVVFQSHDKHPQPYGTCMRLSTVGNWPCVSKASLAADSQAMCSKLCTASRLRSGLPGAGCWWAGRGPVAALYQVEDSVCHHRCHAPIAVVRLPLPEQAFLKQQHILITEPCRYSGNSVPKACPHVPTPKKRVRAPPNICRGLPKSDGFQSDTHIRPTD